MTTITVVSCGNYDLPVL